MVKPNLRKSPQKRGTLFSLFLFPSFWCQPLSLPMAFPHFQYAKESTPSLLSLHK